MSDEHDSDALIQALAKTHGAQLTRHSNGRDEVLVNGAWEPTPRAIWWTAAEDLERFIASAGATGERLPSPDPQLDEPEAETNDNKE